jgi:class 3 adenylate cyclase
MARLKASDRSRLPDSAFAYVDSKGRRRLPINDEAHVRNALARFERVAFEDDVARERARKRLLVAAKRHGIVPVGFITGQLRTERRRATGVDALPTGVVTFLLADIEGSTQLVDRLGDRYAGVLEDVRTLVRRAVRAGGGVEVDARADEYFAVFASAPAALEAAVRAQRSLGTHRWPAQVECRVRIGLHTGRPTRTDTGYIGVPVHAAARVCFAAHGGQVLLSGQARSALAGSMPDGVTLRRAGRHRMAGLSSPVSLHQVLAEGLDDGFPAPRTLGPVEPARRSRPAGSA